MFGPKFVCTKKFSVIESQTTWIPFNMFPRTASNLSYAYVNFKLEMEIFCPIFRPQFLKKIFLLSILKSYYKIRKAN